MASHDKTVLGDLTTALSKEIKGFSKLSPHYQQNLANMVELCGLWSRRHSVWDGWSTFTWQELENWFGRDGFSAINEKLGIFEVTTNWLASAAKTGGYNEYTDSATKGYKLTENAQAVMDRYLELSFRKRPEVELYDQKGRAIKTLPDSVCSRDRHGNHSIWRKSWREGKGPPALVPVNIDNMIALLRQYQGWIDGKGDLYREETEGTLEDWKYNVREINKLLRRSNTKLGGKGFLLQSYQESRSGRLYAIGPNLQTAPRRVRRAALSGLWDYDIENCHFALFSQLAARYRYDAKAVNYYLENKDLVRDRLSQELDIERHKVKVCLLAILYGARANTNHKSAIPQEIASPSQFVTKEHKEKAERLYQHELFKGLVKDIKSGREIILGRKKANQNGFLVNAFGKGIRVKKSKNSTERPASREKQLAHLLQGIEAKALRAVVHEIPDNVVVLMHDGFMTRERIDKDSMAAKMSAATGYKIELSEDRVAP